jgi:hypothetical protein
LTKKFKQKNPIKKNKKEQKKQSLYILDFSHLFSIPMCDTKTKMDFVCAFLKKHMSSNYELSSVLDDINSHFFYVYFHEIFGHDLVDVLEYETITKNPLSEPFSILKIDVHEESYTLYGIDLREKKQIFLESFYFYDDDYQCCALFLTILKYIKKTQ